MTTKLLNFTSGYLRLNLRLRVLDLPLRWPHTSCTILNRPQMHHCNVVGNGVEHSDSKRVLKRAKGLASHRSCNILSIEPHICSAWYWNNREPHSLGLLLSAFPKNSYGPMVLSNSVFFWYPRTEWRFESFILWQSHKILQKALTLKMYLS